MGRWIERLNSYVICVGRSDFIAAVVDHDYLVYPFLGLGISLNAHQHCRNHQIRKFCKFIHWFMSYDYLYMTV